MRFLTLFLLPLFLYPIEMQTRTQALMGTFVDITLPSDKQAQSSHAFEMIKNIEHILSTYDTNAHLYTLNEHKSISTHPILVEALEKSIDYYAQTYGYFDISIGAVTKGLYHFGEEVASPSTEALHKATLNIKGIHLTPHTIHLDTNITLDLGGMGKGFAVDKVAYYLREQNISKGQVALSGDIRCLNTCKLYIQSPLSDAMFASIHTQKENVSISTSGTYRRYALKKEEHHLIDPKRRAPQKNFISVSLFSLGDNSRLDAFATAVSVMPVASAISFLKEHDEISFILVKSDGEILYNDAQHLLNITWLPYKEVATIQTSNESNVAKSSKEKTLTHPNISHPIEIKR
jgi:thiamine biosynthesis lipoprotein